MHLENVLLMKFTFSFSVVTIFYCEQWRGVVIFITEYNIKEIGILEV